MAEILPFPRNEGNGAREVLSDYFGQDRYLEYVIASEALPTLSRTDHLLSWLWVKGFKVVPGESAA